jgi:hypothetical protein
MLLSSRLRGYLNEIVSAEKFKASRKDPYTPIKEIHVGYVHVDLEQEFARASSERQKFLLCEISGIPIILNPLCEGDHVVIFNGEEEPKEKPKEVVIGGVKPSKSWLKKYGFKKLNEE